jgi:NTP pyrophosphatase (non-canonical NTP hydrolase)
MISHPDMVEALQKPGDAIMAHMTPLQLDLLHMAVGVAGEAGELLDALKKHVFYNKPLDLENVVEELGDLEFYMQGLRKRLSIEREDTLTANILKLAVGKNARYRDGYTDEQAQLRRDKA